MKKLLGGIFAGKTVLVTGHTGFKGTWLSLWLTMLGAKVVGYSLPAPTEPSLFTITRLGEHMDHIIGDVRDAAHLARVIQKHNPDIVFHLAAQSLVRLSYREPKMTYETNVLGTVNVLEAIRQCTNVRVCIVVTSDKCYDNKEWVYAYRENDCLGGHDPYSSSKACAEATVAAYRSSFFADDNGGQGTRLSSVRAGNVIGGGDWALDRIVPDVIQALAKGESVPVRRPHAVRPWQYVLDPLAGYLRLAALMWRDGDRYASAWNFGPNSTGNVTVQELVEKIIARWGNGSWENLFDSHQGDPHEAHFLKLDCTKANNLLQWYPVYNINEAVDATVDWYRQYYLNNGANLFEYTLGQIEAYVNKARQHKMIWVAEEEVH